MLNLMCKKNTPKKVSGVQIVGIHFGETKTLIKRISLRYN